MYRLHLDDIVFVLVFVLVKKVKNYGEGEEFSTI